MAEGILLADKMQKSYVIKIGTNVLTNADGELDLPHLKHLVKQVAYLRQEGHQVILVSSGAVGAGQKIIPSLNSKNRVVRRQVYASVGQIQIMQLYSMEFNRHDLHVGQVLATREDFRDRRHYTHMRNCVVALIEANLIPIINENDVVSVDELMFTDNDELAGLVSAMMNADELWILTNVDGVLNGAPDSEESSVITEIEPDDLSIEKFLHPTRSNFGRGGMHTKVRVARKTAKLGITTRILPGKIPNVIKKVAAGDTIGTRFRGGKRMSNVKRWIGHAEKESEASVIINQGAEDALRSKERSSSLLPIGIVGLEGQFKKGDIVKIVNENSETIALGRAQYGSKRAKQLIGKQGSRPLVHYDYLLLLL
ncbi:MAG: glutamate 5-kinase [Saprospiraceae bacterium]|nr:glutamate 5-kinase [Saprospiraceae bacterium]